MKRSDPVSEMTLILWVVLFGLGVLIGSFL